MIRLFLTPPHFECDSPEDASALAKLMGIVPAQVVCSTSPKPSRRAVEIVAPPGEDETARPFRPARRSGMEPTGKTKECKKCGDEFPVLDRTDCPSVYCRACRPAPAPPRKPRLPMPEAVRPLRRPAKPAARSHADPVTCRDCGASVPEFEAIEGQCLECAPIGAVKRP